MPPNSLTRLPHNVSLRLLKAHLQAGHLDTARKLFDRIPDPDVRLWTVLISAYVRSGYAREAVKLYNQLYSKNLMMIDKFVLLPIARTCACTSDLQKAKEIHADAIRFGFHKDTMLGNALIDMYRKCGLLEGAKTVFHDLPFKDVISWTTVIGAYTSLDDPRGAIGMLREMVSLGVRPNSITLSSVLPACSVLKALSSIKEIHCFSMRRGLDASVFVNSALIDSYAKCSSGWHARKIFESTRVRDTVSWNVVLGACLSNGELDRALEMFQRMKQEGPISQSSTWNTMIGGCVRIGRIEEAFGLLSEMQHSGLRPNNMTIGSILPACINLESLRLGREIHGYCIRHMVLDDVIVTTALVHMYAKCGDLGIAGLIFDGMPRKDTAAWNTAILANSVHGCGEEGLAIFNRMIASGEKPNAVTFTAILSACSHSRFVDKARLIFDSMHEEHGVVPDADHYSCMVDVLSRAGLLEEAYKFIQKMPLEPEPGAWGALLAGCRVYKNIDLGRTAAEKLFQIEPDNPGNYIQLSNIYTAEKRWGSALELRKLMKKKGIEKNPGCSWIHVKNQVYTFVKGDRRHPHCGDIYRFLREIREKMKEEGCFPDTDSVLQDVDDEEKEEFLCGHSEKLAVAFGILNLSSNSSIRVFKNLRICEDCHNFIKYVSRSTGVCIVVRDSTRFHHFKNGFCSCRDLW